MFRVELSSNSRVLNVLTMAGKVFKAHLETDLVGVVALGRESVSSSSRSGCFLAVLGSALGSLFSA